MRTARLAAGLGGLVIVSLVLRSTALDAGYWIDEGLSVGIPSRPLSEIPGILRQDGSPPVYYLLLHVWMAIFGERETATHALSLVLALVAIPAAWWAGRAVDGERCAWMAAALMATNGYLTYYAQETRMYSLVVLLSVGAAALAVRVFVAGDRRALPWLVVVVAAIVLTHNWGLLLAVAILAAGVLTGAPTGRGERVRAAVLVGCGVAVLYAPWLPTLLFQAQHTGAPWSDAPSVADALQMLTAAVGGTAITLLLLGAVAAARVRSTDVRHTVALLVGAGVGTIALAFLASAVEPAWATRYVAVAVGPLVLLAALVLSRAGTIGVIVAIVVCAIGLADPRTDRLEDKDNVRAVAARLRTTSLGDADVVVSAHPERGPVLRHYLGPGPRFADLLGPVDDPSLFDWRDAQDRLRRAEPDRIAGRLVASLRPGGRLVLVAPEIRAGRWSAPWTRLVRERTIAWERLLTGDRRLRLLGVVPPATASPPPRTVRALVFRRTG